MVAGGAWLLIMTLLDILLLGPSPTLLGVRLLGVVVLSFWSWRGGRAPVWLGPLWLAVIMLGQVCATYMWARGAAGPLVMAGGMLAGFLLLPVCAPIIRGFSAMPPSRPGPPPDGVVPVAVLRLTAGSLSSRLASMEVELEALAAAPATPAQAIQLRLLRNEVAEMRALVRQRLGDRGHDASPPSPPPEPPPALQARPAPVTPNGLSALVVDDDPVGRTLVRLLLERAGYWVEETDDAKMALEMALMEGPDVALVAARIGRHSGLALSWCIRRGGGPPVILMRARVDIVPERQRARAGLSGMLGKPVTPEGLAGCLAAVLKGKREGASLSLPPVPPSAPPPVPSLPPDRLPVLDLTVLEEHLALLGSQRVAQIIDSFARNAPDTLDQIGQALRDGDVPALGRAAHKLASGALTVGLSALAALAKATDTAAKRQDDAAARDHAGRIRAAFTAGMAGLAAFQRDRLSR